MKFVSVFILLIVVANNIICQSPLSQQDGWVTDIVFIDNANIRDGASTQSKIIGTISQGETLNYESNYRWITDSINGVENFWKPIRFNNTTGYIWAGTCASSNFKSESNHQVLIHYSSKNKLSFKLLKNGLVQYQTSFVKTKNGVISSASIGKTYNSNGNEIFVVKYKDQSYDLYSWDGSTIKLFEKKLRDESFIIEKYKVYDSCIVFSKNVNLRSEPNLNSEKISTLSQHTFIKLIEKGKQEKLDNEWGAWLKVEWKNKTGYIWSNFVSIPTYYIESNTNVEESFLYTTKGLYAFKKNKIVDFISIPFYFDEGFYLKGSLGLDPTFQFIALIMRAESCGQSSGEELYLWNGKKLTHFGSDYGVGDGGFSEVYSLTFPLENGGIKDRVVKYSEFGESIDFPSDFTNGENYKYVISSQSTQIMKYEEDTLIEVPSKDYYLSQSIKKENPKYELYRYEFGDLNADGITDAVCIVSKSSIQAYETTSKPIVLIALGYSDKDFTITESNNNILENSTGYDIEINNSDFIIHAIISPDDYNDPSFVSLYNFEYNITDKNTYWKSKTEAISNNEKWDVKTYQFKTKKVLFTKAWSREMSEEEEEY